VLLPSITLFTTSTGVSRYVERNIETNIWESDIYLQTNYALWFTFWDVWMGTLYNGPKPLNMLPQQTDSQESEKPEEPQSVSKSEKVGAKFSTGHSLNANGTVLLRA
jgi:hypothetical protein